MNVFYSPNVHTGGGAALQRELLNVTEINGETIFLLDERFDLATLKAPNKRIVKCSPTLLGRIKAELLLRKQSKTCDKVLCFHSLPPLFAVDSEVEVFFQNVNILTPSALKNAPMRIRVKNMLERYILLFFSKRVSKFIVQSELVKELLVSNAKIDEHKVLVFPFCGVADVGLQNIQCRKDQFLYVADGSAHKNHLRLVKAWVFLAKKGFFPKLVLTLGERDFLLWKKISIYIKKHNLNIENVGYINRDEVFELYKASKALVFPSFNESFGLPLLEAAANELPILASELDFVREVCSPVETFNPYSELSIARSVARFMGYKIDCLKVNTAKSFCDEFLLKNQFTIITES